MQSRRIHIGLMLVVALVVASAGAQETSISEKPDAALAPLPLALPDSPQHRITPQSPPPSASPMLTTHDGPAATGASPAPLPWQKPAESTGVPVPPAANALPAKIPFGHAQPSGPVIPSGPHSTVAVPVVNVDSVEAAEPAPATPVAPEADPAKEDPAEPTELTAPIFDESDDNKLPHKIVLRVLNKVTAQSALLEAKPGEILKFGQIEINVLGCRASAPKSQTDYAGLLQIFEHLPGVRESKPLFHGWMYASSPSITALEHPIYDVTMVECVITKPAPAEDEKTKKPEKKKAKK